VTELHVATFADLDVTMLYAILRLRSEVFVVEQDCAYQDIDGRDLELQTRHVWLTDGDSGPLAYLRVLIESDQTARIGRVVVNPAARRQGHAAVLLAHAIDLVGDRDVVLAAQTYATDLYARAGFEPDGPEFVEDGIPHLPMRRPSTRRLLHARNI
jgi:ElaA protein